MENTSIWAFPRHSRSCCETYHRLKGQFACVACWGQRFIHVSRRSQFKGVSDCPMPFWGGTPSDDMRQGGHHKKECMRALECPTWVVGTGFLVGWEVSLLQGSFWRARSFLQERRSFTSHRYYLWARVLFLWKTPLEWYLPALANTSVQKSTNKGQKNVPSITEHLLWSRRILHLLPTEEIFLVLENILPVGIKTNLKNNCHWNEKLVHILPLFHPRNTQCENHFIDLCPCSKPREILIDRIQVEKQTGERAR